MKPGDYHTFNTLSLGGLGVHSTTKIWIYKRTDKERVDGLTHGQYRRPLYIMRMGVGLMGYSNAWNEKDNPFDEEYRDNFVAGEANTMMGAFDAMQADATDISTSLFADHPTDPLL